VLKLMSKILSLRSLASNLTKNLSWSKIQGAVGAAKHESLEDICSRRGNLGPHPVPCRSQSRVTSNEKSEHCCRQSKKD
jgi:hypothetical protein